MKKLFIILASTVVVFSFFVPLTKAEDALSDCTLNPAFYKDNSLQPTNSRVQLTNGSHYQIRIIIDSSGTRCTPTFQWKLTLIEHVPSDNPNEPADNIDRGTLDSGQVPSFGLPFYRNIDLGDAGLNHTYTYTLHIAVDPDFQNAYHYKSNAITFVAPTSEGGTNKNTNGNTNGGTSNTNKGNNNGNGTNTNPSIGANNYQNYDAVTANLDNPLKAGSIPELITRIIRILLLLIAMVAVIMIIVGGFRMIASQGAPDAIAKGKKTIIWAVIGLVVALMSFSIVAIIQNLIQTK